MKEVLLNLINSKLDSSSVDRRIDELFGIDFSTIEKNITSNDNGSYKGLPSLALYTSYRDFYSLLPYLKGKSFIDLGAGVGRATLLYGVLQPELEAISIEFVQERILAGARAGRVHDIPTNRFRHADLRTLCLPKVSTYFIYLPTGQMLNFILEQIKSYSLESAVNIFSIESHGELFQTLDSHNRWLKLQAKLPIHSERIDNSIRHYSSLPSEQVERNFFEDSHQLFNFEKELETNGYFKLEGINFHELLPFLSLRDDLELVIEDCDVDGSPYSWLCSTLDVEFDYMTSMFESRFPLRRFSQDQIKEVVSPIGELLHWRNFRMGGNKYKEKGQVRKIISKPDLMIEFSNGERTNLKEL